MQHVGHYDTRVWYDAFEDDDGRWTGIAVTDPGKGGMQQGPYESKADALEQARELAEQWSVELGSGELESEELDS